MKQGKNVVIDYNPLFPEKNRFNSVTCALFWWNLGQV